MTMRTYDNADATQRLVTGYRYDGRLASAGLTYSRWPDALGNLDRMAMTRGRRNTVVRKLCADRVAKRI